MATGTSGASTITNSSAADSAAGQAKRERYIERQLRRTRRQVRGVELAGRLMLLAAAAVAFFFVAAVVDHWLVPGGLGIYGRLAFLVVFLVGAGWFAANQIAPLFLYRINPLFAAQTIERAKPTLKNSLLNFLMLRSNRAALPEVVLSAVEEQAAANLERTSIEHVVDRTRLVHIGYLLLAMVAAFCTYYLLSPKSPLQTVGRVILPWSDIQPASRVTIDDIKPGASTVFRGERVAISALIGGPLREDEAVMLYFSTADRQSVDQPVRMYVTRDSYGRHTATLPPAEDASLLAASGGLQQDIEYHIKAGDAVSRTYRLTVIQAPNIAVERLDYAYPQYTRLAPESVEKTGDIRGLEGTQVTIHAQANQPIASAYLDLGGDGQHKQPMQVITDRAGRQRAAATITLAFNEGRTAPEFSHYLVRFVTDRGHENPEPIRYRIEVTPDPAPELAVLQPDKVETTIPLNAPLAFEVDATDELYGLADVRIIANVGGATAFRRNKSAPREGASARLLFKHIERLDRVTLDGGQKLKAGDVIEYWAEAVDNKTPRPNITKTEVRKLVIAEPQKDQNHNEQQNDQAQGGENQQPQDRQPKDRQDQNNQDRKNQDGKNQDGKAQSGDRGNNDAKNDEQENDARNNDGKGKSGGDQRGKNDRRQQPNNDRRQPGDDQTQPADNHQDQKDQKDDQSNAKSEVRDRKDQESGGNDNRSGAKDDQQRAKGRDAQKQKGDARSEDSSESRDESQKATGGAGDSQKADDPQSANGDPADQHERGNEKGAADQQHDQSGDRSNDSARDTDRQNDRQDDAQKDEQRPVDKSDDGEAFNRILEHAKEKGGETPEPSEDAQSKQQPSDQSGQPENSERNAAQNKTDESAGESTDERKQDGVTQQPQAVQSQKGVDPQAQKSPDQKRSKPGDEKAGADTQKDDATKTGEPKTGAEKGSSAAAKSESAKDDTTQKQDRRPDETTGGESAKQDNRRPSDEKSPAAPSGAKGDDTNKQPPAAGAKGDREKPGQAAKNGKQPGADDSEQKADDQNSANNKTTDDRSHGGGPEKTDKNDQPASSNDSKTSKRQPGNDAENQRSTDQADSSDAKAPADQSQASGQKKSSDDARKGNQSKTPQNNAGKSQKSGQPADEKSGAKSNKTANQDGTPRDAAEGQQTATGGGGAPKGDASAPPPPASGDPPQDDQANEEYARRATDLALEHLRNQLKDGKADEELLDRLGWSQEDLQKLLSRWERLQREARQPGPANEKAKTRLRDAIESLGWTRPGQTSRSASSKAGDAARGLRDAARTAPPREYQDAYEAFKRRTSREAK